MTRPIASFENYVSSWLSDDRLEIIAKETKFIQRKFKIGVREFLDSLFFLNQSRSPSLSEYGCAVFDSTHLKITPVLTGIINATIDGSEIVKGTIVELENSSVLALRIPNTGQNTSWKIGAISFNNVSNPFLITIVSDTNLNEEALYKAGLG